MLINTHSIKKRQYEKLAFWTAFATSCRVIPFPATKWLLLIAGATLLAWWLEILTQYVIVLILYFVGVTIWAMLLVVYKLSKASTAGAIYECKGIYTNNTGIHAHNELDYTYSVPWKNVNQYQVKRAGIFLCTNGDTRLFIPSAMLTREDKQTLLHAIKQYLSSPHPIRDAGKEELSTACTQLISLPEYKLNKDKEFRYKIKYLLPFLLTLGISTPIILSLLEIRIFGLYFILCWMQFAFILESMFERLFPNAPPTSYICTRKSCEEYSIEKVGIGIYTFARSAIIKEGTHGDFGYFLLKNGEILPCPHTWINPSNKQEQHERKPSQFMSRKLCKWILHGCVFIITWIITIIHIIWMK